MTIEEISLLFDYGLKEGREKALELLEEHQRHDGNPPKRSMTNEDDKAHREHVERA